MEETKKQIQDLISLGNTEKALELLETLTSDAVLLQSRFNSTKKQYGMGMLEYGEWSRTQAQINYAIIEMMNGLKGGGSKNVSTTTSVEPSASQPQPSTPSASPSNGEALEILMLTANPAGTTKLNLDKEYARISEKLQSKRNQFNLTVQKAVNRTEFKEFTETKRPSILHFSGHGEQGGEQGGILVQNEDKNDYELVSPEKLDSLFDYFKSEFPIQAVVFNACFSQEQAAAIANHVPYVVGTTSEVIDEHAIAFSTGFYFKIVGSKLDFEQAFKSGRMEAVLAGAKKENFVLYKNAQLLTI